MEEGLRDPEPQEEEQPWEERTLSLLQDSKIDQELSGEKEGKKWGKKHKVRWMKRPMTMPQAILEFLDEDLRENAIRYLSNYLVEKREEDPDNYYRAGFLVFNSCATMSVLLQEIVGFYVKMVNETLNVRSIKRLANVLTLFQVSLLAVDQELSPRLLFHIIRCYIILCKHDRGYFMVMNSLPDAVTNGSFHEVTEEFPVIRNLMHQLLVNVGKMVEHPILNDPVQVHTVKEKMPKSSLCIYDSVPIDTLVPKPVAHDQVTFLPSSLECC
ncbi:hypothetical protein COCNU_07G010200 [Cocos nucifera]|uniref:Uncharacterized protein n=1 Tax=Cocos nucifera TaxID=13894 RepID=A0A8K0IFK0_COCNU|nr:hypothetical protein COCNU_07G010200 [Cocos nucifera]